MESQPQNAEFRNNSMHMVSFGKKKSIIALTMLDL